MPIGEDIPILIPLSIILVVFLLFLFTLFANTTNSTSIIKMSQTALNIGDYILYKHPDLSSASGLLNGTSLYSKKYEWAKDRCSENACAHSKIKYLSNVSSPYKISIKIKTNQSCWCWGETKDSKEVVTNNFPTLIINKSRTMPAMVIVSVSK